MNNPNARVVLSERIRYGTRKIFTAEGRYSSDEERNNGLNAEYTWQSIQPQMPSDRFTAQRLRTKSPILYAAMQRFREGIVSQVSEVESILREIGMEKNSPKGYTLTTRRNLGESKE